MSTFGTAPAPITDDHVATRRLAAAQRTSVAAVWLALDAALIVLGFTAALVLHSAVEHLLPTTVPTLRWSMESAALYALLATGWLVALVYENVYRTGLSSCDPTERIAKALTGAVIMFAVITTAVHVGFGFSRLILFAWYTLNLALFTLLRPLMHSWLHAVVPKRQIALQGSSAIAASFIPKLIYHGFHPNSAGVRLHSGHTLLCLDTDPSAWSPEQVAEAESQFHEVAFLPPAFDYYPFGAQAINVGGLQFCSITHPLDAPLNRFFKRAFDLILGLPLLVAAIPLGLTIAAIIWLDDPGPVFFCHYRIGRNGKPFPMWKFRSMLMDAEERLQHLLASDPELRAEFGTTFKLKNDPRITRIGSWLRRSSLDELPQIWNVIRGDMSLVGPRPIVKRELDLYGPLHRITTSVRPGMTGLWQVSGRSDVGYASRRSFDISYVRRWSPWLDISILVRTIQEILLPSAY